MGGPETGQVKLWRSCVRTAVDGGLKDDTALLIPALLLTFPPTCPDRTISLYSYQTPSSEFPTIRVNERYVYFISVAVQRYGGET